MQSNQQGGTNRSIQRGRGAASGCTGGLQVRKCVTKREERGRSGEETGDHVAQPPHTAQSRGQGQARRGARRRPCPRSLLLGLCCCGGGAALPPVAAPGGRAAGAALAAQQQLIQRAGGHALHRLSQLESRQHDGKAQQHKAHKAQRKGQLVEDGVGELQQGAGVCSGGGTPRAATPTCRRPPTAPSTGRACRGACGAACGASTAVPAAPAHLPEKGAHHQQPRAVGHRDEQRQVAAAAVEGPLLHC